jgi:hypothetical protein
LQGKCVGERTAQADVGIGFTRNECVSSRRRLGGAAVPRLSQMGKAVAVVEVALA